MQVPYAPDASSTVPVNHLYIAAGLSILSKPCVIKAQIDGDICPRCWSIWMAIKNTNVTRPIYGTTSSALGHQLGIKEDFTGIMNTDGR